MLVARMARLLDAQNVPTQGRWIVVDPVMMEVLRDEDSRLLTQTSVVTVLQNGLVLNNFHGFRVHRFKQPSICRYWCIYNRYCSTVTNYGVIVAGHDSSVATAEQINKTETYRDPDSFADIVRGMHLYGRKILRPEGLVTAKYNLA